MKLQKSGLLIQTLLLSITDNIEISRSGDDKLDIFMKNVEDDNIKISLTYDEYDLVLRTKKELNNINPKTHQKIFDLLKSMIPPSEGIELTEPSDFNFKDLPEGMGIIEHVIDERMKDECGCENCRPGRSINTLLNRHTSEIIEYHLSLINLISSPDVTNERFISGFSKIFFKHNLFTDDIFTTAVKAIVKGDILNPKTSNDMVNLTVFFLTISLRDLIKDNKKVKNSLDEYTKAVDNFLGEKGMYIKPESVHEYTKHIEQESSVEYIINNNDVLSLLLSTGKVPIFDINKLKYIVKQYYKS